MFYEALRYLEEGEGKRAFLGILRSSPKSSPKFLCTFGLALYRVRI